MATIYPTGANDPYWSNVVLLMDGSSPTQDLSSYGKTVTAYGDIASTTAPSSPPEVALQFNRTGTVDYLLAPETGATLTHDFCFECRVYITAYAGGTHPNDLYMMWKPWNRPGSTAPGSNVEIKGSSGLLSIYFSDGTYRQGGAVPLNRFVHLAETCCSDVHRLFIDGKLQTLTGGTAGATSVTNTINPGNNWRIGGDPDVGNGRSLNGYMRDIRITFGACRYTADFVPPALGGTTGGNAIMFSCNT